MAVSPASRSLHLLREEGWTCQVVEKFIPWSKQRVDLYGFIDICCIKPYFKGVLGVQTTSGSHTADRIKKIKQTPEAITWLRADNAIEVHGWRKLKIPKDGKYWQVDRREITLADLEGGGL